ncbi:CaiB/BaiF CoA-transferase family protein [Bordetella sp. BOR01]|uniref:CaiB/BaiF CoA transferase family protein n=1 Tax=Bordetella sp. BOR01 TaxID=2854779 RepID=UPI001C45C42C|nr:CoA transferase [Bordetella sp. BOR01]MBV7483456.1 CoA transferase [Bordetella sp. BOR01]
MQKAVSPLDGLKILDLSQIMAGPYCTMVLGDLGAEVIKIERPGTGDDAREMGPYVNGESTCFAHINRNKHGLSLNLKDPQAREVFYEMVKWADVVVENFRVGVTQNLGVDYATLARINPALIYCSISGYGQTGPYSRKGGFDLVVQGLTGMMSMTGEQGGAPLKSGIAVYDVGAGLTATYAILAAVIHRMKTGEGQHIDIALAECGLPWFVWESAAYFADGTIPAPTGSRHRVSAPYQAFRTGDGYIVVGAANQRSWERLCTDVVGRPDLIEDARFVTNDDRIKHVDELEQVLEAAFQSADAATWIARCEQAGVPCGPINNFAQAMQDPHFLARGMIQEIDHPKLGRMQTLGTPTKFSKTPTSLRKAAPTLGQDTARTLRRFGVDDKQIDAMRARGALQ